MAIEIKHLPFQPKAVEKFILFAWKINQKDPHWVPPLIVDQKKLLNPDKNPFFKHSDAKLLGAYRDGKMVGRLAIGVNHHSNKFRNEKMAFFGFFECENDVQVCQALFNEAQKYAKLQGMTLLL